MEEDQVEDITFLTSDKDVSKFVQRPDSKPTKEKVNAFKNRVFSLIMLFVENSKDFTPLTSLINEELYKQNSDKTREIINILVNKNALDEEKLKEISHFIKNLLLFKGKKDTNKYADDLIKTLKKIKD